MPGEHSLGPAHEYLRDAWQRSILFLDVLRQRGNIYEEQQAKNAPHVLEFDAELVLDGRTLARPLTTSGDFRSSIKLKARCFGCANKYFIPCSQAGTTRSAAT